MYDKDTLRYLLVATMQEVSNEKIKKLSRRTSFKDVAECNFEKGREYAYGEVMGMLAPEQPK